MEKVKCNYCGSGSSELVGVFGDIAFDKPGEFPFVRCQECGLVYLQERPTSDEINFYYPSEYQPYRTAIQDERSSWMRRARQRNIDKYSRPVEQTSPNKPGKVLDVGCSTGIFLDAMRQLGWETEGVEISSAAVQYARRRFGLDVFQGQLFEARFAPDNFDVVTLWNVFEHLFEPFETLKEVHHILKKNGILILVFPNWESLDRRIFKTGWVGYDAPRHLFVYPRSVCINMLMDAKFEIAIVRSGPNNYFATIASLDRWMKLNLRNLWLRNNLLRLANIPGMRFVFQPLISLLDHFGWGGTIMIVARKI